MENKYINTIQIVIKSRNYSLGDSLILDIKTNKVYVVIIALDAGESQKKKIKDKCNFYNIKCIDNLINKEELETIFKKSISAFGIKDANLAKKFISNL